MIWLLLACGEESKTPETTEAASAQEEAPQVEETTVETLEEEQEQEQEQASASRQIKRMSIAQVRDSMEQISGIRWGSSSRSNWDVYSDTLGVADYQSRVKSDRSPSVMFQKFLDDAAVETCSEWIGQSDSSFFSIDRESTAREDVQTNILHARWLIQGKIKTHVPIVDDYSELFFTVFQRTDSPNLAWQSICVAAFTHPDFFMY